MKEKTKGGVFMSCPREERERLEHYFIGKYKLKSRTMNLAETELVVEAKLTAKQMDSLEALLDSDGVSDVNIVGSNGSTLL